MCVCACAGVHAAGPTEHVSTAESLALLIRHSADVFGSVTRVFRCLQKFWGAAAINYRDGSKMVPTKLESQCEQLACCFYSMSPLLKSAPPLPFFFFVFQYRTNVIG